MTRPSIRRKNKKSLSQLALAGIIAGGIALAGCKKTTDSNGDLSALEQFIQECETAGMEVERHASCNGTGSCAGSSIDITNGNTISNHDCAAKNTCAGATCLDPTKKADASGDDTMVDDTSEITLEEYIAKCQAEGKTVKEHDCSGKADCAGTSFNADTGMIESHVCNGYNSCAGASCQG